jgi:hypothetical protein
LLLPGSLLGGANLLHGLLRGLRFLSRTLRCLYLFIGHLGGTCLLGGLLDGSGFLRCSLGSLCLLGSLLRYASPFSCLLQFPCLLRCTLSRPSLIRGLAGSLRLFGGKLCGINLFGGTNLLSMALRRHLGVAFGHLLSSLLGSLLCNLLSGLLHSVLRRQLRGLLRGQLGGLTSRFLTAGLLQGGMLFIARRLRGQPQLLAAFCLGPQACPLPFLLQSLLYPQTRLFAGLGSRRGKIPVLCAMEIGPGVERCYILGGLILIQ